MDLNNLKYGELHVHSCYSDGFSKVERNIEAAVKLGHNAIATTEHGTLSSLINHWDVCNQNNITPILGCEFYLRLPETWNQPTRNSGSGRFHMTMLSTNFDGYCRLVYLNNAAHQNMETVRGKKYPILTLDMLTEFVSDNGSLLALTGCPSSVTFHDNFSVADEYINFLVKTFTHNNVYAEIMPVEFNDFDGYRRPVALANKFGLKTIFDNDVHAAFSYELPLLQMYTKVKSGYEFTAGYITGKEDAYKTAVQKIGQAEADKAFKGVDEVINRIEAVNFKRDFVLPDATQEVADMWQFLETKLADDIAEFTGKVTVNNEVMTDSLIIARFNEEKDLILKYNFSAYFAILWDILKEGHKHGVLNVARGSASGSYILYLLGVTQLNPIEHDLMFERFLAELRLTTGELPDVDVDISANMRHIIQEYAHRKWHFSPVGTINTYSHSSLVRLISRIYEKIYNGDLSGKLISAASHLTDATDGVNDEMSADELMELSPSFKKLMSIGNWAKQIYDNLKSSNSGFSAHACAVVPLDEKMPVPIESWGNESVVMYTESGSHKTLQSIGYVKYDFLSLSTLAVIQNLIDMTGVHPPKVVENNDNCFAVFNNQSLTGIFQFDTRPGKNIIKQVLKHGHTITSIHDLAILTSIIRPGAAQYIGDYCERKTDLDVHPQFIREIYEQTGGVIIYQEQVAQLFAKVAFDTYDKNAKEYGIVALKALVPKNQKIAQTEKFQKQYKQLHDMFMTGGLKKGLEVFYLENLFTSLEGFIRYGFNKSHALSYANISAQMAWFKYYYPTAFWSVILASVDNTKQERFKLLRYIVDATIESSLTFIPPHINTGSLEYKILDDKIQAPMSMLVGLGENTVNTLIKNQPYISLADVAERSGLNRTTRKTMYEAGMLEGLPGDLYDLGVLERKSYILKDKTGKWGNALTGTITKIMVNDGVTEIIIDNIFTYTISPKLTELQLDIVKKLKVAPVSSGDILQVGLKVLFYASESAILAYKKLEYVEPSPVDYNRLFAIKKALGFNLTPKLKEYYQYAEDKDDKVVGYVVEINERKTEKTTQLQLVLESDERVWICLDDRTDKKHIIRNSEVNLATVKEDIQVGDLLGITLVMSKKDNVMMSFGQVKSYKKLA